MVQPVLREEIRSRAQRTVGEHHSAILRQRRGSQHIVNTIVGGWPKKRQRCGKSANGVSTTGVKCSANCVIAKHGSCFAIGRDHHSPIRRPFVPRRLPAVDARRNRPARSRTAATRQRRSATSSTLIQRTFKTDVCSVYLLEADRSTLVLAATIGLRPESVGRIRMKLTEGLAGLVGEQLRPQVVEDASRHPRFKYFSEAGEDPYHSFLGVPLIDRGLLQGVLVVQTIEPRAFDHRFVRTIATAGAQLAPIVSQARTHGQFVAPAHQRLEALAQNLWWSWDRETSSLFRDLDPELWRELDHNPIALLQQIPRFQFEERVSALALHSRINHAYRRMQEHLTSTRTWGERHAGVLWARPVAYFSAEFGLHESVPIYSGRLGILAGDHIKSASDLGIPLVGIGLYYDQGYFRQRLDRDGHQIEDYRHVDSALLPIQPALDANGIPLSIWIETRTRHDRRARLAAGRRPQHAAAPRLGRRRQSARRPRADIAALRRRRTRPHQAGTAARRRRCPCPRSDGHRAGVAHLNEGHSAFAPLELARMRMVSEGIPASEALRRTAAQVVFTTHTPVPAGHDRFPSELVEEHLGTASRRDRARPGRDAGIGPRRSA